MEIAKLKKIDLYRKSLTAERYTGLKRIAKYYLGTIKLYILGINTWFNLKFLHNKQKTKSVDVLLFQHSEKVIKLNRKKALKSKLRELDYNLLEIPFYKSKQVLKKKLIKKPSFNIGIKYLYYAAYAEYIVSEYNPKLLLNDRNGMLLAPFLREALNRNGAKLIQLAHATTVEDDWQFSMNDYDYYFLFGHSSYNALNKRNLLFGSSKVILSGSHMIGDDYNLPALASFNNHVLLFGMGPDREKTELATENYQIILDWIRRHSEYTLFVKLHPRSKYLFWQTAKKKYNNIKVLDREVLLSDALKKVSIVLSIESNAILEAALTYRPIIFVNIFNSNDIFSLEKFYGRRADSHFAISHKINEISKNYSKYTKITKKFSEFHLENGTNGLDQSIQLIDKIIKNKLDVKTYSLVNK